MGSPYGHASSGIITPMGNGKTIHLFKTFRDTYNGFDVAAVVQSEQREDETMGAELTDEDLMLASTTVYGFSFSDKTWCKLNSPLEFRSFCLIEVYFSGV
jgi:hypothetical protein